jgi:Fe-Mn family superoxide dismutase
MMQDQSFTMRNHREEYVMTSFDQNDHSDTSMNRRTFLAISAGTAFSLAMAGLPGTAAASSSPHALPALPWGDTDLEPVITARTLSFH